MVSRLFWLASYPKSGNTWVRVFLAHWFHGRDVDINRLDEAGMSISDTWPEAWRAACGFIPERAEDQARVKAHVQAVIAKQRDGVSICKTHSAAVTFRGSPQINKEVTAGALYIVRDPRDVCLSMMRHYDIGEDEAVALINGFSTSIQTKDGISQYVSDWYTHVQSWAWAPCVRYEDLWHDPFMYFDDVLHHLGIDGDPELLGDTIALVGLARMQGIEAEDGFTEAMNGQFFGKGGSRWQKELSKKSAKAIWTHNRQMMEMCGYRETPLMGLDSGFQAPATTTGSIPASPAP